MKTAFLFLMGFCCLTLLSGCGGVPYSEPNSCSISHLVRTPCGPCILNRCQNICKYCKYREASCTACFNCINYDKCESGTCGVNYP